MYWKILESVVTCNSRAQHSVKEFPANFTRDFRFTGAVFMYVCMVITYSKGKDQPGKVANPARGQLNKENYFSPVPVRA